LNRGYWSVNTDCGFAEFGHGARLPSLPFHFAHASVGP